MSGRNSDGRVQITRLIGPTLFTFQTEQGSKGVGTAEA